MEIQWLGHSAFRLTAEGKAVLIDPYFSGNPKFPADAEKGFGKVDHILVTHGHGDHLGDTLRLAKTHNAQVVSIFEIAHWLGRQGYENCVPMNIGGTVTAGPLSFTMVNALHSAGFADADGNMLYMGVCAGFVVKAGRWSVYHTGDTDVFSDMALIQRLHTPNVGLVPIGGHFTMDARGAALACNEFLDLEVIVPMHYRTFPVLAGGAEEFKKLVKRGRVEILEPGGTLKL